MPAIVILNIVFVAFVVIGMLSLLGWAIATDRGRFGPQRVLPVRAGARSRSPRRRATRTRALLGLGS
jgi:hypothetical protein